jgi:hypothetical protein
VATLRGTAEELAVALQPEDFAPARALWRASAQRLMGNWLDAVARRKTHVADARRRAPAGPTRSAG